MQDQHHNQPPADTENAFFQEANPKLEEVKKLLHANSSSSKLEGMKRLIAMISKGKNVSSLFPDVVVNIVCDSFEVKKLVYLYLVHYAEFEPEAALLSINTFQKDLKDPNQLIRSQALRVLSSIRLRVILQIVLIAVQTCVQDSSAYVRKTAAHAIPKVFSLDPSQKGALEDCIETLLGDNTTLVLGSAVAAYMEVCPERFDLIHPHFRKLCNMLADTDEWGQIYIINMLTRYARTQFLNPNDEEARKSGGKKKSKSFYSDEESDEYYSDEEEDYDLEAELDPDHRLLIRAATPLLQSRNSGVVLAVAGLFFTCAPLSDAQRIGKALVRIARSSREKQYIVLANIATMASQRPNLFSPFVTNFFVRETDSDFIRLLKLEILTYIASESNISKILREFNTYVHKDNQEFVSATVQAIGRCAARLPEVQDTCMHGLMSLLANKNEIIVAESVVVIKRLLQMGAGNDQQVVKNLAKLLPTINVANARASITWVVGEYCEKIPLLAPDILRVLAKGFRGEEDVVKLQIVNLAVKLLLVNPAQTQLLAQYVLNLAKYDLNYDIRDRVRLIRGILFNAQNVNLKNNASRLFRTSKVAPKEARISEDRQRFLYGSLSHIMNHTVNEYIPLQEWPKEKPDPSTRDVAAAKQRPMGGYVGMGSDSFTAPGTFSTTNQSGSGMLKTNIRGFYSDEEDDEYTDEYSEDDEYDDYSDEYSDEYDDEEPVKSNKKAPSYEEDDEYDDDYSDEYEEEEEEEYYDDDYSDEEDFVPTTKTATTSSGNGLLDLMGTTPTSAPSTGQPTSSAPSGDIFSLSSSTPISRPRDILLKHMMGGGLQVEYQFSRSHSDNGLSTVQLFLSNKSTGTLTEITCSSTSPESDFVPFSMISSLLPNQTVESAISVKFASASRPLKFTIRHNKGSYRVELPPIVGELLEPIPITFDELAKARDSLSGMNESSATITLADRVVNDVLGELQARVNAFPVQQDILNGNLAFSAKTLKGETVILSVEIDKAAKTANCRVNSENTIFAGNLLAYVKKNLSS